LAWPITIGIVAQGFVITESEDPAGEIASSKIDVFYG
jgi:hypothetical protein